ncbi:hypothetical protein AVEN_240501-1 [Araneus ventricosus]|uniref:DUF4817 domain-containing protein n=1 Tax=Araneus ventricosus TaxID=182803 RepID=A0A4Y2GJN9_ARAVE|nr:hypothetical protein AVEN_240501-1 [Araneus ventricosus]
MERFSKNECFEMFLLYGKCGSKARLAGRFYQQRFPAGSHPSHITILQVVKRSRETGCVASRPRSGRPVKVGRQVQPEDELYFALTYLTSSKREKSQNCGLSKSRVWKILIELGAYPYRPTSRQILLDGNAERRYTWCNIVMNHLEVQPTFLEDIVWTDEACLSWNGMFNRQNTHNWALENPTRSADVRHQI